MSILKCKYIWNYFTWDQEESWTRGIFLRWDWLTFEDSEAIEEGWGRGCVRSRSTPTSAFMKKKGPFTFKCTLWSLFQTRFYVFFKYNFYWIKCILLIFFKIFFCISISLFVVVSFNPVSEGSLGSIFFNLLLPNSNAFSLNDQFIILNVLQLFY